MKQKKNMYVLIYICYLLHIYVSRNVDSYIDNAFERAFYDVIPPKIYRANRQLYFQICSHNFIFHIQFYNVK